MYIIKYKKYIEYTSFINYYYCNSYIYILLYSLYKI